MNFVDKPSYNCYEVTSMEHQFKKIIKCRNCGKNYKTKNQKGKLIYVCSGWANYGKEFCIGFVLQEEELIYTVSKHLALLGIRVEGSLREYVSMIEVKGNGFVIHYKDHSRSVINSNEEEYGVKVKY